MSLTIPSVAAVVLVRLDNARQELCEQRRPQTNLYTHEGNLNDQNAPTPGAPSQSGVRHAAGDTVGHISDFRMAAAIDYRCPQRAFGHRAPTRREHQRSHDS